MDQRHKILLTLALILAALGLLVIVQTQSLGKLRLVFCDVGQGDGMLLITPSGKDIVVDGGPGTKIVDCLGENLPFWDRTIEMVVLTHPQKDHMEGLLSVLSRYKVKMIATTGVENETELFKAWQTAIKAEGARIYTPKAGDRLVLDSVRGQTSSMDVLWPTSEKLEIWKLAGLSELNKSSVVLRLEMDGFCAYLTSDIPNEILVGLIDRSCQVLKISHHGSKTGTNQEILDSIDPKVAIIQVGKNSFGHPHKEVLEMLGSKGVKIYRNDINGVIELKSDGDNYKVKSSN
ncbi:MAG: internalization-related competence protein ComEC/Rec2 protein [Candidatus Curtissbacteria bacterium GW2011_GWA2_41_24]|uniref:Internalization-related competence protein ComEC/Rec2 protein n=1 Tax=Candidatus Curtissbacteria bacterium GW2011_GWA2_41_24 TaxID=1618411 RepID=A0A0G0VSB3_9BACT|nr:MAG: internalization-related competence protein ComEC/Rec2 protein [Candidatus Curtissbacteria bacterium GW2011_GWA2_41_24]